MTCLPLLLMEPHGGSLNARRSMSQSAEVDIEGYTCAC